ncbi:MAG: hypothetical protein ACYDEX_01130 [Mobilitalea sp.]
MMKEMFVPYVRSLRNKEIEIYESKGYVVSNKAEYTFTDKINIIIKGYSFCFGIRVNINEVYFYLLDKGTNIYLTVMEIYDLLWKLVIEEKNSWVLDELEFYNSSNETTTFFYHGKEFYIHKLSDAIPVGMIKITDADIMITYDELFLLIYLIQDKSNYFESLSIEKRYINGLIRLLKVLLECNSENVHLATLGWKFNNTSNRYELLKEKIVGKRNKKRYYLTVDEERLII